METAIVGNKGEKEFYVKTKDFTLYHGTCYSFLGFSLKRAVPFKDYGKGFYLTSVFDQAVEWAREKAEAKHKDRAYVYEYLLERDSIDDKIRILEHLTYTVRWLDLIADCRINAYEPAYDLIYDRMADGDTERIVKGYRDGKISEIWALNDLKKWRGERDQFCFKTEESIKLLKRTETLEMIQDKYGEWSGA